MTNEEKILLLQDICAKLPYGMKVQVCNLKEYTPIVKGLLNDELFVQFDYNPPIKNEDSTYNIINDNVKPYLRPMSSMVEGERKEYNLLIRLDDEYSQPYDSVYLIDWLNAHHFDYRGLIEKGLAIEAPEGMYNI